MVSQAYTISTVKNSVPPKVKMSQYDSASRTITFTVVDGSGTAVSLTGKTVTVEGTRIDGHAFAVNCTVSGSTVSFTETVDMTNTAGDHPAELVIRENGQRLGTMNFVIAVESAAMDENASITEEDESLFNQLYTSIDDAVDTIADARDEALSDIAEGLASGAPLTASTVSAMTDTTTVYLYTGSETGYNAGSWYYYNGSAWTEGGIYGNGTTDTTLTLSGTAADAKATGDAVGEVKNALVDDESVIGVHRSPKITTSTRTAFAIPQNTTIKIYTLGGEDLPSNKLKVYDSSGTYIDYFTLNSTYGNARIVNYTKRDVAYIGLNSSYAKGIAIVWEEFSELLIKPINFSGDITNNVSIVEDYYLDATGELTGTTGAATTEFIAVEPGDVYEAIMVTTTGTQWMAIGRYADYSGGFIQRETLSTPTETSGGNKIFKMFIDIPPDDSQKSVRISFGANYASYSIRKVRKSDRHNFVCKSVNHRGFYSAPENTLPAFNLSKLYGFNWVETDVQFTQDGVPVLLHDDTINRTARNDDGTELPSAIDINSIDYDDLLTYDFGIYKGSAYSGIRISTLAEGLKFCKKIGLNVRLELKSHTVDTSNIASIISIIEASGMSKNIELASFDSSLILYIDSNYPLYDVSLIQTTINSTLINTAQTLMSSTKHKTSCCVSITNTEANLNLLAATGVPIDLYTIDTVANALSAGSQANSFTTNRWDVGTIQFLDSVLDT